VDHCGQQKKVPADAIASLRQLSSGLIDDADMPPNLDDYIGDWRLRRGTVRLTCGVYAGSTSLSFEAFGRHRGRARSLDSCGFAGLCASCDDT
jgi:hypothetical protein